MATSSMSVQMGRWQGDGVRIPNAHLTLTTNQAHCLVTKVMQRLPSELMQQAKAFLVHGYEEVPTLVCRKALLAGIQEILADPRERKEVLAQD